MCVSSSTILKGLGLEGKLTADQIAKKWDNLRTKYKVRSETWCLSDAAGRLTPLGRLEDLQTQQAA